jgi:hypothetical protein
MRVNSKNKINKILYLIDNHIINLLGKKEIDEEKIETLTSIRIDYIKELNNIIRVQNTSDMYKNKK